MVHDMAEDYKVYFESEDQVYFSTTNGAVPNVGDEVWLPQSIASYPDNYRRVRKIVWAFEDYFQHEVLPGIMAQRIGRIVHVVLEKIDVPR